VGLAAVTALCPAVDNSLRLRVPTTGWSYWHIACNHLSNVERINFRFVQQTELIINGTKHVVEVDDDTPLLWILRDSLGLTGTKFGCGVGVCGACTILENGEAVRACQIPCSAVAGRNFTTIEGLSPDGSHPCQRAWIDEEVAQCGYCQAGMIMTACALLKTKPTPTDADIDAAMSDSVCRCGTYPRMRKAIVRAATAMHSKQSS
jgi:isoquinoline 1-oxidoreductase alpha subunit